MQLNLNWFTVLVIMLVIAMIIRRLMHRTGALNQRICPSCNAGLPRFAKFCARCGKRVH